MIKILISILHFYIILTQIYIIIKLGPYLEYVDDSAKFICEMLSASEILLFFFGIPLLILSVLLGAAIVILYAGLSFFICEWLEDKLC